VLGDVEVLLDMATGIGQEGPLGADRVAELVGLEDDSQMVGGGTASRRAFAVLVATAVPPGFFGSRHRVRRRRGVRCRGGRSPGCREQDGYAIDQLIFMEKWLSA
jgi:hypothetical protein